MLHKLFSVGAEHKTVACPAAGRSGDYRSMVVEHTDFALKAFSHWGITKLWEIWEHIDLTIRKRKFIFTGNLE